MSISKINNNINYYYTKNVNDKSLYKSKIRANRACVSANTNNIWDELRKKYDITNATFDEVKKIAKKLYKAGEISLLELSIICLDPSKIPALRRDRLLCAPREGGRHNWIKVFRDIADRCLSNNLIDAYKTNIKIVEIFEKLKR
ncbi:hypothetical protein [Caloranaerobacter sp. DY30410]|uniref:hypothetical protein n=1 Tax=Caloranaerobacter sp. DY30410 TaxID=3238305 RepID=UPI003CFCA2AA